MKYKIISFDKIIDIEIESVKDYRKQGELVEDFLKENISFQSEGLIEILPMSN